VKPTQPGVLGDWPEGKSDPRDWTHTNTTRTIRAAGFVSLLDTFPESRSICPWIVHANRAGCTWAPPWLEARFDLFHNVTIGFVSLPMAPDRQPPG
jgi:hypothetical protein